MRTKDRTMTAKRVKLIELLLTGCTQTEAAKTLQVSGATVHRWLAEPEVAVALAEARGQRFESVLSALDAAVPTALATMVNALAAEDAPWRVRLSAAAEVLKIAGIDATQIAYFRARYQPAEEVSTAGDPSDPSDMLAEVRAARKDAQMRGSMVAAVQLLKEERALVSEIQAEQRREQEQERAGRDESELMRRFGDALDSLPDDLAEGLYDRLRTRLRLVS